MKIADKSYWTNTDKSKLVEEGSTEAAFLVVGKGSEVTEEMAQKYGIKGEDYRPPAEEPGVMTTGDETGDNRFVPAADIQAKGIRVTGDVRTETETAPKGRLPEDFPHF